MVSTHSSQYITDFTPTTAEPGKSPLALLAKTCETIGLPEGSSSKKSGASPSDKKDEKMNLHHSHSHHHQQQSKQKSSPRSTPQSKEPTLTFPGLPKPSNFPMGMPTMGFPFFNPMMSPYQMPGCFPGAFPMAPGFMGAQRMPCPFAMMRQPCANPGCIQCPSSSSQVKSGQMSQEMMAQFAAHPLFSMYAGMMPNMNGPASYQALLAASASAAAAASAASSIPTDYSMTSKPSTSSASATTTSETKRSQSSPSAKSPAMKSSLRYQCNWVDSDVRCGKSFDEETELTNHVKKSHAPSPSSSSASSEPSTSTTGKAARSSTTTTPQRFNPYGKPQVPAAVPQMMAPMGMAMNMNPLVLPFSLQAMYGNRLMPTVAHQ